MISVELAWGLVGVAAGASWRWSRPIAVALACVFLTRLAYLQTHLEALRWVAIVPSVAGVYELVGSEPKLYALRVRWRDMHRRRSIGAPSLWDVKAARDGSRTLRICALALACVASSASDGAAAITHRLGLPWSLQYVQSAILLGMIFVCAWPGKEASP